MVENSLYEFGGAACINVRGDLVFQLYQTNLQMLHLISIFAGQIATSAFVHPCVDVQDYAYIILDCRKPCCSIIAGTGPKQL